MHLAIVPHLEESGLAEGSRGAGVDCNVCTLRTHAWCEKVKRAPRVATTASGRCARQETQASAFRTRKIVAAIRACFDSHCHACGKERRLYHCSQPLLFHGQTGSAADYTSIGIQPHPTRSLGHRVGERWARGPAGYGALFISSCSSIERLFSPPLQACSRSTGQTTSSFGRAAAPARRRDYPRRHQVFSPHRLAA